MLVVVVWVNAPRADVERRQAVQETVPVALTKSAAEEAQTEASFVRADHVRHHRLLATLFAQLSTQFLAPSLWVAVKTPFAQNVRNADLWRASSLGSVSLGNPTMLRAIVAQSKNRQGRATSAMRAETGRKIVITVKSVTPSRLVAAVPELRQNVATQAARPAQGKNLALIMQCANAPGLAANIKRKRIH